MRNGAESPYCQSLPVLQISTITAIPTSQLKCTSTSTLGSPRNPQETLAGHDISHHYTRTSLLYIIPRVSAGRKYPVYYIDRLGLSPLRMYFYSRVLIWGEGGHIKWIRGSLGSFFCLFTPLY